jgi:hypothetical protein
VHSNGGAVLLCATGPGLTPEVRDTALPYWKEGVIKLFGVSDAYRVFGNDLDYMYSCDPPWWDHHWEMVKGLRCEKWTQCSKSAGKYKVNYIRGQGGDGLSTSRDYIIYGNNSGYQALNIAYLMGFRTIVLAGYNMQPGPQGQAHFFGPHPKPLSRSTNYRGFIERYKTIPPRLKALGLRIVNTTPNSALTFFESKALKAVLEELKDAPGSQVVPD